MSEANGTIPGTSDGSPGHPAGTHEDGHDIDIAYYQLTGSNNWLRSICPHTSGSADQYHCVGPPTNLDVWRTALFVGKIHETSGLRVIGMDGQIGPLVESALTQLCARGWLNNSACTSPQITYETTDMGRGWFRFHHHHMHVSITSVINLVSKPASEACLVPNDCSGKLHDTPHMCQTDSDFSRWTLPSSLGKSLRAY
jgi:hypothetical protein